MSFEPQKLFVGLVGLFAVILPGALLAYIGEGWIASTFFGTAGFGAGWERLFAFLFVAYLLGHFVFLLGSGLDDLLYEPLREATHWGQIVRLSRGRTLSSPRLRRIAASRWLFPHDAAVLQARRIKAAALAPIDAIGAVNTYQWAKIRLSREHPDGLRPVERFETDSKFFRSLAVVLALLVPIFLASLRFVPAVISGLLVVPALWRYVEQRYKAIQLAYWQVIELEGSQAAHDPARAAAITAPPARADGITHAGGVVYREGPGEPEYLLVESSRGDEWVLPKGHLEPWEPATEAAVREVFEEAGVWARIVAPVLNVDIRLEEKSIRVRFFLMEALDPEAGRREERRQFWLPLDEAIDTATHEDTKILLAQADQLRPAPKITGSGRKGSQGNPVPTSLPGMRKGKRRISMGPARTTWPEDPFGQGR